VRRHADRHRRLAVLEAKAAEKAAAEAAIDWGLFFSTDQLLALLETVELSEAGAITEAEAEARLAAVPGLAETFERALAARMPGP